MDLQRLGAASSVDDVIAVMRSIDITLPQTDGVWWFNRLYLRVTEGVRSEITAGTFLDPVFLEQLDVVFASLYFDALRAGDRDLGAAPPAWRPLIECRYRSGLLPIQFALAGMNAHINRDLPVALVKTCATAGAPLLPTGPRRADYDKVNDLLAAVEANIKSEFSTGVVALVDAAAGQADDVAAMWDVRAARQAAWTNGEVLWSLQGMPALADRFLEKLDRLTGFAGRGLLVPRLARA